MRGAGRHGSPGRPGFVNILIVVAGVVGLAVAAFFLIELLIDAARRRQYVDIGVAAAVVVATVWLLFAYGDSLLQ